MSNLKQSRDREHIETSLQALDAWLRANHYKGYEPFDGLNSFLRPLTMGTKFGRQALVQLVKRSPMNLRPWIGIHPATSTKGMGFLARGYLRWSSVAADATMMQQAAECLAWLRENSSSGYSGPCWGNHFDYQTRWVYLPAETPTVVWSSLIGQAFVDYYEESGLESHLCTAAGTCKFILNDLPRHEDRNGTCISYVPCHDVQIHNANALAAGLLARVYKHTRDQALLSCAKDALAYTANHQNKDGSWYYGPSKTFRWIDNWHSAYVLDSFLDYFEATGDRHFHEVCQRGWSYYFEHFFMPNGCPRYYSDGLYPIDIQCASQSIETLCRFRYWHPQALDTAKLVALWTIENMQDDSGYFYFQRARSFVNRVPCFHWAQGTMFSALSALLKSLDDNEN